MENATTPNNLTLNSTRVGWMPEPNERGTISLLYSCLFTIFICTWSTLHMNLPADGESPSQIFLRKMKWMAVTLVAPEFLFLDAVNDFEDARKFCKEIESLQGSRKPSKTYGFFAGMGGFAVHTTDGHRYRLRLDECLAAIKASKIELPDISDEEIKDKSKADWMVKSIACVQVTWLAIQLIGRVAQRLPITSIELFTLAMVVCALFIYAMWWSKPLDVMTPFIIRCETDFKDFKSFLTSTTFASNQEALGERVSMLDSAREGASDRILIPSSAAVCILFGGCHLLGWNFDFASQVELWLWRVSAILCMAMPLIIMAILTYDLPEPFEDWPSLACTSIYVLARAYLLVEIIVSLRSVPRDVYTGVEWANYFPHI